ncbi:MAG: chromosome segregation protein SMC, partial [Gemmatimonadetes bacterium]|nr:chromosome segregation protein SMC [Gemmatimonadota bacterium]
MRLTKLEMQGFKSFADATTMLFDNGVTAIVGPNGCGKSNVSDAVRWVLGEQRARLLRGAKMEEVIFQGSSARRAVNVAEVSLHFENEDGQLPVAFKEVVVTRRLSRSGESEYLLNGAACRLRDIHDMLRGTGLGADTGVVIEAKMIDALLSDRPDDRRELFEEAAGVGLYRDRRRSTERRLEETALDLNRLDDLITEVQSQVRSLARQRKKAERSEELMKRRFGVELTLASREMAAWHAELQELEVRVAELRESAPGAGTAVTDAEQARTAAQESRAASEGTRNELAQLLAQQQQRVQALRGEMAVGEERRRHAIERRQRAEDEQRDGAMTGERLVADRERATEELTVVRAEAAAAIEQVAALSAAEDATRAMVTERRRAVEDAERVLREARDQIRRLEMEADGARRESTELEARTSQLAAEREVLVDAAAALQREIAACDESMLAAAANVTSATAALAAAREAAREAREREAAARTAWQASQDSCANLEARLSALEGLERERVGLAPAAARLLRERERFGEGAILGPVSDFVSAGTASAALVERFLGMTLHAVVVRDGAVADAVRAWHVQTNPGPLLLLPLDVVSQTPEQQAGDLLTQVDVTAAAATWVRTLLAHVQPVDDGAAFIDARGAVWLPGTVSGPGPLRRRAELFALRAELQAAHDGRARLQEVAALARETMAEADAAVSAASERMSQAQTEDRRANDIRSDLERRRLRGVRELEEADALATRLVQRRESLETRLATLAADAATIESSLPTLAEAVERGRAASLEADAALEAARATRTAGQITVAQLDARAHVAEDRLKRIEQEYSTATTRLTTLAQELSELSETDRNLALQMADWQADLDTQHHALRDVEERHQVAVEALRAADQALAEADQHLDATRRALHERESSLYQGEVRLAELSGKRAAIRERLEAEWRRPLEDLMTSYEAVELDDDALRAEADQLRAEVERLGPVNPLAIEEHEEEIKRLDFLTTQRTDLAEARNKLQLAIREIDTTAREMFLATFAQVRDNFRQIFMTLFGGGECDLRLENPELPLDCDIEVHASPRGKRTQRIHLLSSGERALVALSLLFGIFLTKPSPFCLLDEVDAPLDDANIGRYVRMLTQFKERTQFIVITHNPRTTTEAADAVYGVTMQEPGVSSLVSVRMRGLAVDD